MLASRGRATAVPRARALPLDAASAAWLLAIPCLALVAAAAYALGPALGRVLAGGGEATWPWLAGYTHPEPTETARYAIAIAGPLLLSAATVAAARRPPWARPRRVAAAVLALQLLLVCVVAACVAGQRELIYPAIYRFPPHVAGRAYFTVPTLAAAVAIACALAALARSARVREAARLLLRESRARRVWLTLAALAATAVWMLHALHTEASIATADEGVAFHLAFTFDETFAVLNGRTPLVDFTAQYGSLWPFAVALPMAAFGKTLLVYTLAMCALTTAALVAIFDVMRRAVRSSAAALLLYLPFLATSLFMVRGTFDERYTYGAYFGVFPLRYAGPYLLAWGVARHIERGAGAAVWPLFGLAGLVALNNADYGLAAFGASLAALLWTQPWERRALGRLALEALAGLALALAVVSAFTLLRAGSLPQLGRLVEYARVYARDGFGLLPLRGVFALHTAMYLTYVGAIATATVRALRGARDVVLTGMLAWSGVFGLGAAAYYVALSSPDNLVSDFSAWALSLALLTVVAVRQLAARRPTPATLLVLAGMGLAACSLAQTPSPWTQLARLTSPPAPALGWPFDSPVAPDRSHAAFFAAIADGPSRFVRVRGAPVALLVTTGHRAADAFGVVDVAPYTGLESINTLGMLRATIDALRRAGGNTAILPPAEAAVYAALDRWGFRILTTSGLRRWTPGAQLRPRLAPWPGGPVTKWVDGRHLHPRALATTS